MTPQLPMFSFIYFQNLYLQVCFVTFPQDSKFLFELNEIVEYSDVLLSLFLGLLFKRHIISVKYKATNIKNSSSSKCHLDFPIKNPHSFPFINQIFFLNVVVNVSLHFIYRDLILLCKIVNGKCGLAEKNIGLRLSEDNISLFSFNLFHIHLSCLFLNLFHTFLSTFLSLTLKCKLHDGKKFCLDCLTFSRLRKAPSKQLSLKKLC